MHQSKLAGQGSIASIVPVQYLDSMSRRVNNTVLNFEIPVTKPIIMHENDCI